MADNQVTTTSVKSFLKSDEVQKQISATLGAKSTNFTASVLALVGQDELLSQAVPATVFSAALTAAALDLPINKNLGFAHIVGYKNNKKGGQVEAQFQMGWKGFVQLAQRSGHYKTINTEDVREGEIKKRDRLSGEIEFDWKEDAVRQDLPVVGYVAYFRLTTGFEKTYYMSFEEVDAHAYRYSQSYKSDKDKGWTSSNWTKNFDAMAKKTVVKLLISKWGPMSTELEKAITYDQAVIKGDKAEYADGGDIDLDDVGASSEKKNAILAANGVDDLSGDEEQPTDFTEKARKRYGSNKQSSLIEDDNDNGTSSSAGN